MSLPARCPGSYTASAATTETARCPECKRERPVVNGGFAPHRLPPTCAAVAYSAGRGGTRWPTSCPAPAREGSAYCGRHGQ